jgi:hypothetical protein
MYLSLLLHFCYYIFMFRYKLSPRSYSSISYLEILFSGLYVISSSAKCVLISCVSEHEGRMHLSVSYSSRLECCMVSMTCVYGSMHVCLCAFNFWTTSPISTKLETNIVPLESSRLHFFNFSQTVTIIRWACGIIRCQWSRFPWHR